ncbi:kinase-like domain-containing protein [Rhizophagus irregularis DAOM 181602=DAOM 197198]|nr:kinase-like domain-containing protein [Rhizophagus irregularis DAOM 181602=DAOM 197198]
MTIDKQTDDSVDWVEKAINENYIKYYNCSEFTNIKEINGNGSAGKIYQANWKGADSPLVIKSSYKLTIKEIVNELKIQREIDFHPNILRFYGISRLENQMNKFSLVIEYADSGSLHSYLKENFNKLEWCDKYRLALQLASAVECIHNEGIIHCDLHAHNVLIHQNNIKLADFGLSRKTSEASIYLKDVYGVLPYVDPKCLNDQSYAITTKSDIYSIGVLLWQLSSGRRPFYDEDTQYDVCLAINIKNGKRENIIEDTPPEYSNLYKACWLNDPDKRPAIQQVVLSLKSIISKEHNECISAIICKKELPKEINSNPISIDNEFDDLVISDFILKYDLDTLENKILPYIIKQVRKLFNEIFDSIDSIIDKLISLLIEIQDKEGYNFLETNQFINHYITLSNQTNNIFNWLIKNQSNNPQYIFFLGFLYYNGIIVDKDNDEAFKLFSKASEDNYNIAQVYLSKCYQTGVGTEINSDLAINCLNNSIKNNSICGQLYLGNLYEDGKGTNVDLNKAFYWYERAANHGNLSALYHLGECYEFGDGIEKDEIKAFELYKKSAEQEYVDAQNSLGYYYKVGIGECYEFGDGIEKDEIKAFELYKKSAEQNYSYAQSKLGYYYESGIITEMNLEKAVYWYQKAADNGDEVAQYNLGLLYENGKGIEKDEIKAFELYKKSAENDYNDAQNQLGYCYESSMGIEKSLEKAVYWYQKAADNGDEVAQYNLGLLYENGKGVEKDEIKAFEFYKKSADQGFADAQYRVGYCHDHGIGVNIDKEKAFEFYKVAARKKNRDAQKSLALLYERGEGTKKCTEKAIYWYEKAGHQSYK